MDAFALPVCVCVSISVEVSLFKGFSGRTLRNAFGKNDKGVPQNPPPARQQREASPVLVVKQQSEPPESLPCSATIDTGDASRSRTSARCSEAEDEEEAPEHGEMSEGISASEHGTRKNHGSVAACHYFIRGSTRVC